MMKITIRFTLTFPNGNTWDNCKETFDLMDLHSLIDMNTLLHDEKHSNFEIVKDDKDVKEFEIFEKAIMKEGK